jgi:hypothetical protein
MRECRNARMQEFRNEILGDELTLKNSKFKSGLQNHTNKAVLKDLLFLLVSVLKVK